MKLEPEKIAIVGCGFSGVMTAVNLSRLAKSPMELTIVNHVKPLACGTAYSTKRREHLLNVAARNMSAFPDLPTHFLEWLRTQDDFKSVPENELRERFVPRMIYGDYLRSLLRQYLQSPANPFLVQTSFVEGEAVEVIPREGGATISLADGKRVETNRIVLALGNEPPCGLPGSGELKDHPAWAGNPWQGWEERLPAPGGTIVVLGTGLTTVDVVVSLNALGWPGVVHAVSRNGWLPKSHFRGIEYPDFPPAKVDLADLGLKDLVALMEKHCARLRQMGANPAIIVDKMRPFTQRIWQRFTLEERREFVRLHAARWNVLRHRIAPEIHAQLTTAQLTGRLQVHAAGIDCVRAEGNQVRVHLVGGKTLVGDLVINATGPNSKFTATRSVLLQNLLRRGLAAPDATQMGIRVDEDHTIIDRDGRRSEILLALGPPLRGTLWETVAVPELRGQARRMAETLLDQAAHAIEHPPVMMEYMI